MKAVPTKQVRQSRIGYSTQVVSSEYLEDHFQIFDTKSRAIVELARGKGLAIRAWFGYTPFGRFIEKLELVD